MKLYTYDPAPNPRRLQLFMDYKGIEIETVQVNLMEGEQLTDAYRAINPAQTVPALVTDDGALLTEVIGACVYLEELYPEKPLMGTTALEKAQIISWDHKLFNGVLMAIAEVFRNGNPVFAGRALPGTLGVDQIPALVERGNARLAHAWGELDKALEGRDYLVGDSFTFADIDLLATVEFAGWIKAEIPAECSKLQAWHQRASAALPS